MIGTLRSYEQMDMKLRWWEKNACRILLGKPLAKCPLGRTRRWKDNIHMVFWDVAGAGLYHVMFFVMFGV